MSPIRKIWISEYVLQPLVSSVSAIGQSGARNGALLKLETRDGFGYADVHPWTELGDEPLGIQLRSLAKGQSTPLTTRSLEFASRDALFRAEGRSFWSGASELEQHLLISNIVEDRAKGFDGVFSAIENHGFTVFKVKLGRNVPVEVSALNSFSDALPPEIKSKARYRLDPNGLLDVERCLDLWASLDESVRSRVDFVEDAVPWSFSEWTGLAQDHRMPLALDRALGRDAEFLAPFGQVPFRTLVLKPAVERSTKWEKLMQRHRLDICVTSYLDHPVGQMHALFEASELRRSGTSVGVCGLASHLNYFKTEFSDKISLRAGRIHPPPGCGVGFDEELASRSWKGLPS